MKPKNKKDIAKEDIAPLSFILAEGTDKTGYQFTFDGVVIDCDHNKKTITISKSKESIKTPLKPVTKRDKHMYDLGAEQQAMIFDKTYQSAYIELGKEWTESLKSLGDRQEPITNFNDEFNTWSKYVLIIAIATIMICAVPYILAWVNNQ